jgi:hypothetical protein
MSPKLEPKPGRRFNLNLCHEAGHYVIEEQNRRKRVGEPHTKLNDIVNDWIIEAGKRHGHIEFRADCGQRLYQFTPREK